MADVVDEVYYTGRGYQKFDRLRNYFLVTVAAGMIGLGRCSWQVVLSIGRIVEAAVSLNTIGWEGNTAVMDILDQKG